MLNFRKFQEKDGDFDYRIAERVVVGRLTPLRYKVLTRMVRKFNSNAQYPYGISPNGYAYNCGCEHDCCGCLCGESINIDFAKAGGNYIIKLTHSASFNY